MGLTCSTRTWKVLTRSTALKLAHAEHSAAQMMDARRLSDVALWRTVSLGSTPSPAVITAAAAAIAATTKKAKRHPCKHCKRSHAHARGGPRNAPAVCLFCACRQTSTAAAPVLGHGRQEEACLNPSRLLAADTGCKEPSSHAPCIVGTRVISSTYATLPGSALICQHKCHTSTVNGLLSSMIWHSL